MNIAICEPVFVDYQAKLLLFNRKYRSTKNLPKSSTFSLKFVEFIFVKKKRGGMGKQEISWSFKTLRSSRQEVFCEEGILRNFTTFTGKHLCQSLFLNKVAGLRPATLLKKRLWHRCFPVNFVKFLRTPFLIEHLWWLLQNVFNMIQYTFELVRGLANGYLWLNSSIDIFDWSCTT